MGLFLRLTLRVDPEGRGAPPLPACLPAPCKWDSRPARRILMASSALRDLSDWLTAPAGRAGLERLLHQGALSRLPALLDLLYFHLNNPALLTTLLYEPHCFQPFNIPHNSCAQSLSQAASSPSNYRLTHKILEARSRAQQNGKLISRPLHTPL